MQECEIVNITFESNKLVHTSNDLINKRGLIILEITLRSFM